MRVSFTSRSGPTQKAKAKAPPGIAVKMAARLRTLTLGLADRLVPAPIAVLEHAHAFTAAHLLAAIAELGLADHLCKGPKTAAELAPLVGADADALHRALRAAATIGLVRLDHAGRFHATRLTKPLRSTDLSAVGDWCCYIGSASVQAAWSDLGETLRCGDNGFRRVNGLDSFTWFAQHPDEGRRFSAGLGGLTRLDAAMIMASYTFPHRGVICDVGGGAGVLLSEVLRCRPELSGVLVETPMVLKQAAAYLDSAGVADRVKLVEGDFFQSIVEEADLYLLKWVLHDWDDATCTLILGNVAAAMPPRARLVVIEGDQDPNRAHPRFSMIDLQMLTVTEGGRERSSAELQRLLDTAGLIPDSVHHTPTGMALVEATAPAAK
jgi:hypothetical protein